MNVLCTSGELPSSSESTLLAASHGAGSELLIADEMGTNRCRGQGGCQQVRMRCFADSLAAYDVDESQ